MKYLADLFTLLRFVLGFVVLLSIVYYDWQTAVIVFIIASLTDAVDGFCARKWPYSSKDNSRFPWRKDPHSWDNIADSMLTYCTMLGLIITISYWRIVAPVIIILGGILVINLATFSRRDPDIAEKLDVALGWFYVLQLFAMLISITMQAVEWWPIAIIFYAVVGIILLIARWDKATSRPDAAYKKLSNGG